MSLFGEPMILLPYDKPGCLAQLEAFLLTWARRLLWLLAGFAIGWGVSSYASL